MIRLSDEFKKGYWKIKDKTNRLRINNQIKKLKDFPESGKPLKHDLKGMRSVRVPPFRIIYKIEGDNIDILAIGHRDKIYESAHKLQQVKMKEIWDNKEDEKWENA